MLCAAAVLRRVTGMDEGAGIEDEADLAISEDGGSSEGLVVFEPLVEAFDHDLLFTDEFIDEDAALLVGRLDDDDEGFEGIGGARGDGEVLVEA